MLSSPSRVTVCCFRFCTGVLWWDACAFLSLRPCRGFRRGSQERILKGEYGEGEHFTYSYGLVFMNRFLGFLFSAVMLHYTRPKWCVTRLLALCFSLKASLLTPSRGRYITWSWCSRLYPSVFVGYRHTWKVFYMSTNFRYIVSDVFCARFPLLGSKYLSLDTPPHHRCVNHVMMY